MDRDTYNAKVAINACVLTADAILMCVKGGLCKRQWKILNKKRIDIALV